MINNTFNFKKQVIKSIYLLIFFSGLAQAGGSSADLSVTKDDGVVSAIAGGSLTYTMVVTNNGPDDVTGVTVTDTFPTELTNCSTSCAASAGSACTAGPVAGNLNDTLVDLLNGGTATYTSVCDIMSNATGTLSNTVNVTAPAGITDPTPGNNAASDTNTVITAEADLSISKIDDVDPINPGGTLTYTIEVNNPGPSDATNVIVTDTLPADVSFVSTNGCNEDPAGNPSCTLGTIVAGTSSSYTLQVTVDNAASGSITNNASVTSDATDNNNGNNNTSEDTQIQPEIDLSISKSDDVDPVAIGGNLVYTIEVSNSGPSSATNVTVTDNLPAGTSLVSTSGCAEDPVAIPTCSLGTIASGSSTQYSIIVTVDSSLTGIITNTATVSATETDINASNDTASETTDITSVSITSDTPDPSSVGQDVTVQYTVTGNSPSGNVTVSDGVDSCVGTVASGNCVINLSTVGSRSLTAEYAGDGTNPAVTSVAEPHEVVTGTVTLDIDSINPNPVDSGQPVTVSININPVPPSMVTPTGTVTISDGTFSCVINLPGNSCNLVINASGDRDIVATYNGDANYASNTSATVILNVVQLGGPNVQVSVPSLSLMGVLLLILMVFGFSLTQHFKIHQRSK